MTVTTEALQPVGECIEACHALSEAWHRYAKDYAVRGNKRGCFANAGFDNKHWSSAICRQMAVNDYLSDSIDHHRTKVAAEAGMTDAEFRRKLRVRSEARLDTYVWLGNPDPKGLRLLFHILTEGVEDRESAGGSYEPFDDGTVITVGKGRRVPTMSELGRKVLNSGLPEMQSWNDLSEDELLGLDSFSRDRHGVIKVTTNARWASDLWVKVAGLAATTKVEVAVTVSMEAWTLKFAAAVAAEALTLSQLVEELRGLLSSCAEGPRQLVALGQAVDDLAEAVPQLEVRVLGRVG